MQLVYIELDAPTRHYFRQLPIARAPVAHRTRLARKSDPGARTRSVAGLWLLASALGYEGIDCPALAGLVIDTGGQPRLPGGPGFSISHSIGHAACAVIEAGDDARHVGLDIEPVRTFPAARMARLAAADEKTIVARDPARFFDFWCAREATVKATGRVGLKRIKQIRLAGGDAWLDGQRWLLQPLTLAPGLAACLASDAPAGTVRIKRLTAAPRY